MRGFIERFNRGGIEAIVGLVAADWVGHPFPEWPSDPIYHGRDGMRKLAAEWTDSFDEYRGEIKELIVAGDRALALVEHHGPAKRTGMPREVGLSG